MTEWAIAFIASTGLAAAGFVVVAVLWLKKLREALAITLGETAGQQVRTAQRLSETMAAMQRRQHLSEQRLQTLTEANIHMRHELNELAGKVEMTEREHDSNLPSRLIH